MVCEETASSQSSRKGNGHSASSFVRSVLERFSLQGPLQLILQFLPFQTAYAFRHIIPELETTPSWCTSISLAIADLEDDRMCATVRRHVPFLQRLTLSDMVPLQRCLRTFTSSSPCGSPLAFQSLVQLHDRGTFLELIDLMQRARTSVQLPNLEHYKLSLVSDSHAVPVGRLVSKKVMPNLRTFHVEWGKPTFEDTCDPVCLDTFIFPRGWSLNQTVQYLASLPKGSKIRNLHMTYAMSESLISDITTLHRLLDVRNPQVYVYHLSLSLSTDLERLWNYLSMNQDIHFKACSVSIQIFDLSQDTLLHLQPLVFRSKLKRFELRDFSPTQHSSLLFKFNFSETPHLLYLRGDYTAADHDAMAKLLKKHPHFQTPFKIAFNTYDTAQVKLINMAWTESCPFALTN